MRAKIRILLDAATKTDKKIIRTCFNENCYNGIVYNRKFVEFMLIDHKIQLMFALYHFRDYICNIFIV